MCIRIGWARFTLTDNILKFGVANVECSVSGKFYRGYPHVKLLLPPEKIHVGQGLFRLALPKGVHFLKLAKKSDAAHVTVCALFYF